MQRTRGLTPAFLISLVAMPIAPLLAQATLTPPKLLQANCEYVKPGMRPAHDRHEERWARTIEGVKGVSSSLAVQSMTGPDATCWLVALGSYEAIAKDNALLAADAAYSKAIPGLVAAETQYLERSQNTIATLRPDLSGGEMPNVLSRRVTRWTEFRIRPGKSAQLFESTAKAYRAALVRAGVTPDYRIYQVVDGLEGRYWLFDSQTSMAGFDAGMANDEKIGRVFTPEDTKLFDEFYATALISETSQLWSYVPAQSSLTAEQRGSDAFWKRNPVLAAKP